jgi:hypothetical protein
LDTFSIACHHDSSVLWQKSPEPWKPLTLLDGWENLHILRHLSVFAWRSINHLLGLEKYQTYHLEIYHGHGKSWKIAHLVQDDLPMKNYVFHVKLVNYQRANHLW